MLKELCLWRTHAGAVSEGLQIVGKTHAGAGKQCEEEVIAERNYHGLTHNPCSFPSALLQIGELGGVKDEGVKLSLEIKGRAKGKVF